MLEDIEDLVALCAGYGLRIVGAEVAGEVLQLVPVSLEGLPGAAVLGEIAEALRPLGYRYVTLDVLSAAGGKDA